MVTIDFEVLPDILTASSTDAGSGTADVIESDLHLLINQGTFQDINSLLNYINILITDPPENSDGSQRSSPELPPHASSSREPTRNINRVIRDSSDERYDPFEPTFSEFDALSSSDPDLPDTEVLSVRTYLIILGFANYL